MILFIVQTLTVSTAGPAIRPSLPGPAWIRGCLTRILDSQMLLWNDEVVFMSDMDRSSPVPSWTKVMRGTWRASGSGRSATFSFMNLSGR